MKRINLVITIISILFIIFMIFVNHSLWYVMSWDHISNINTVFFPDYLSAWSNKWVGQWSFNAHLTFAPLYLLSSLLELRNYFSLFILLLFLLLTFHSAYLLAWTYSNSSVLKKTTLAIFYTFNPVTYLILTSAGWYTWYFFWYFFIAYIIFAIRKFILCPSFNSWVLLLLLNLFSLIWGNNPVFLLPILGLSILLSGSIITLKESPIKFLLICTSFVPQVSYLLMYFLANKGLLKMLSSSSIFFWGVWQWIKDTSVGFLEVFSFSMNSTEFYSRNSIDYILLLIPVIILIGILFIKRNHHKANLYLILLLLIYLAVVTRWWGGVDFIKSILFGFYSWGYWSFFRSPEKLFIFIPIIFFIIFGRLLSFERYGKILLALIISFSLISFPMDITKSLKAKRSFKEKDNYYSTSVDLPNEYLNIDKCFGNGNPTSAAVISLPFTSINALNWNNYSSWLYVWSEPFGNLTVKNIISPANYAHPSLETQLLLKDISLKKYINPEDLLKDISKFYSFDNILIHKDISPSFIDRYSDLFSTIKKLNDSWSLKRICNNDYYDIYEVTQPKYIKPVVLVKDDIILQKVHPTRYDFSLRAKDKMDITFFQSYHPDWNLYIEPYFPIDCDPIHSYMITVPPEQIWKTTYIVKSKDTLKKVSENIYGTTILDIMRLNPWVKDEDLKVWQKLFMPIFSSSGTHTATECKSKNEFYAWNEIGMLLKKPVFDESHKMVYEYANQWVLDSDYIKKNFSKEYYLENPDGSISVRMSIYFKTQSYFYLWIASLMLGILWIISYFIYSLYRRN